MIVSLVSMKGGVGKSALARLLAVEVGKAGWNVKIADLDPAQGTSTKWKVRRDRKGWQPDIAVEKYRTVQRATSEASNYDLMILDGPAHAGRSGLTMARQSSLVLMPTGYSLDDLEAQVEAAYDLEEGGVSGDCILFVFCRARGSLAEDGAARAYLGKAGLSVVEPVMPELPSIRQAHAEGRAASEVPHASVRQKVLSVAQAIVDRMLSEKEETT